MPTSSLKEFAQVTPVCEQTSGLADVLEIFRSSGCDAIVVVSPQHYPLGVVNLSKVMPHLSWARQSGETSLALRARDSDKPLSELEPPIIEPLAILPEQLSLSQFWVYLQDSEHRLTRDWGGLEQEDRNLYEQGREGELHLRTGRSFDNSCGERPARPTSGDAITSSPPDGPMRYADATQRFCYANVSLSYHLQTPSPYPYSYSLDASPSRLYADAPRYANPEGYPSATSAANAHANAIIKTPLTPEAPQHWALVDEEGKFLGLLNSWLLLKSLAPNVAKTEAAPRNEQPQPTSLKLLVQLLEHLPLPLSIQTTTGQVLAQNLTWRQQIGTSPNLDWVRRTTAAMLDFSSSEPRRARGNLSVPEASTTLPPQGSKTPCESLLSVPSVVKERCKTSEQAAVQRFCAIDTPRLAAAVSTQQVIFSTPPLSKTQKPPKVWEATTPLPETLKKSQERVFSFVKLPLSPSVFEGENAQECDYESDLTASSYHPSICDLCVVLAQDTTEQQQVAKELAAKNADLIQLNRLKDEFLACISHELKTPLTAVLGLSTLLKDQALGELNERQARYARLIYQSGRQLMTLVNDILDLTRMETGQLELTCEPVQIQNVCDRAYSQAHQHQQEKEQQEESTNETKFTLEIEPGLEMLVADELRLRQMLAHLLSNALKFTDAGGEIGLRVNRWEGWIAFTVWDTGIGIPPEKQHLIFQKFQQLEQPLTRRYEGTGLGLVLTQRLARLHGGDVSFISKPSEGSQFTLLLPPCPPQARGIDGESLPCSIPNAQCPIRNRLVLIVETVPCYLDSLTEHLKSLGYRVIVARSGTEAIAKARGLQPRAILLNPLLPQLSGWDVLTLLKSDAQTSHIPVLVTATQAEKQQAYQNKADGFLSLPVQKQALLQSLTGLEEPDRPTSSKSLTILHLSPVETCPHTCVHAQTPSDSSILSSGLTDLLSVQHSELNYRVLEADDLEQAELLARVWQPDVVLLDAAKIADPLAYLQQFALHPDLVSIPLVTLDHQTTEAANQVEGLSVYPCLAPDNSSKMTALLQVIQVAAGMSLMLSIVVMDIGDRGQKEAQENSQAKISPSQEGSNQDTSLSPPLSEGSDRDLSVLSDRPLSGTVTPIYPQQEGNLTQARRSRRVRSAGAKDKKSQIATPVSPHSSWLQALMQYLQTAGFRSVLSCSWTEIYRQLQEQSVDLLLIRLKDISDYSELINGLMALTQLENIPPILVLDHRSNADSKAVGTQTGSAMDAGVTGGGEMTFKLDSLLTAVATQILREPSLSMTQLLDQINQALGM